MNTKDFIEIFGFAFSLVIMGWRIASIKNKIELSISNKESILFLEIAATKQELYNHIQLIAAKDELLKFQIDTRNQNVDAAIVHINKRISGVIVFERIEKEIKMLGKQITKQREE
ncbi:hypothetical protein [Cylindrospermum sp. FACHB-282]|uniref:hypothetical protein n=1 Tax=Cylindrospermum sp. FACHB-282 TaxID=2692794 RepID=UPI0016875C11|nr:hypothetical protein [Cylindrospermum sp. FACHB-282]MBD2388447.1 hypothetical protein [Cylindrospermum sp. FACHB-282]